MPQIPDDRAQAAAAVLIRCERPADHAAVRETVADAFGRPAEAELVDRLRSDGDGVVSLVAVEDGGIVGHVLFSRMTAPFPALGLAPVSVRPDRRRSGIGGQLIRAGLERAARGGWRGVFVLGDPAFYRRFGFDRGLAGGFSSSYAGPRLTALAPGGALPATTGRIGYAPAFGGLG